MVDDHFGVCDPVQSNCRGSCLLLLWSCISSSSSSFSSAELLSSFGASSCQQLIIEHLICVVSGCRGARLKGCREAAREVVACQ